MADVQVLVVDDDPDVREVLDRILSREGVRVSFAGDGQQGLALVQQKSFQVLFTDLCMPGIDGLEFLRRALRACPQLAAVVFTGYAGLESCIEAMRLGACDYVTKPFTPQMIRAALARALDSCERKGRAIASNPQAPRVPAPAGCTSEPDNRIVAESAAMCEVRDLAAKVAPADAAVLIRGEPGVGKGVVARAIHRQSRRAGGPFVQVTCCAVHEAELGVTLFGREQRDFEHQEEDSRGLLESANGGTVYLADVDCLPLWAQVQLFDAFQTGCVHRSASFRPVPLDVRVIASTSCDLEAAVAENQFHSGLYYLLNVVTIRVPPLRERQQDIKILAERCLAQATLRQGITADEAQHRFTQEAWQCLLNHDWPGNLPELASVVAHAVAISDGKGIGKEAIRWAPRKAHRHSPETISVPLAGNLREVERHVIQEVIQRCGGNKAAAARALGLHRRTLYRMLKENAAEAGPAESREDRTSRST